MSTEIIEETKQAEGQLSELTASARKMLTTFDSRIRTLARHKQLVRELHDAILRLKEKPDSKADTMLVRLILSRIKSEVLPPFALVNPQIADIITYRLGKVREEEIIDIDQIKKATRETASSLAKKRLLQLENKFKEHIQKIGKDTTFTQHLREITELANSHAKKQQELIQQEYNLILETEKIIGSEHDNRYDTTAQEWKVFIEELDNLLKEENDSIIKQMDFLFEEDHSVASKIKQRLASIRWIGQRRPTHEEITAVATKISEADIAEDLETLTTHAEIHEYVAAMMLEAHNLTPEARRYLSVQGEIKAKEAEERERNLTKLATRDSLTGALNKRTILEIMEKEISKAKRTPKIFSFLYIDIDHFKRFNDTYGHAIGDAVLRHTVNTIQKNVRTADFVGRLGGEELCVFMPDTDKEGAARVAEKIRDTVQVASKALMDGINSHAQKNEITEVTISTGVSTFPEDGQTAQEIIDVADGRLYKAKKSGRNTVISI
jgi:diguanylate cyclase (GGDEF)-like protein